MKWEIGIVTREGGGKGGGRHEKWRYIHISHEAPLWYSSLRHTSHWMYNGSYPLWVHSIQNLSPSLPLSLSLSFFWLESMDLHLGFLFFISNFSGPFNFIYLSLNILFPYDSVKMNPTWFFHTPMLSSKTSNDLEWTF